jgi:DeoR/GlpR family transcriptional regulator of sugar metabolism
MNRICGQIQRSRFYQTCRPGCDGSGSWAAHGVTDVNLSEAEMKLRMARSARRVVLLVYGSRLGRVDVAHVWPVDELDLVVTGQCPPSELEALRLPVLEENP